MQIQSENRTGGKLAIYFLVVLLPAVVISISTYYGLPDSWLIVSALLVISAGIAAVFMYYSGDATRRVQKYCIIAAGILGVVMCLGLIVHVLLTRELAIAKEDEATVMSYEDRADRRRKEQSQLAMQLMEKQKELAKEEKARLRNEAIRNDSARRLGLRPLQSKPVEPPPVGVSLPTPDGGTSILIGPSPVPYVERLTPMAVRHKYSPWMVGSAIADVIASVLLGVILAGLWEWNKEQDQAGGNFQVINWENSPKLRIGSPAHRKLVGCAWDKYNELYGIPDGAHYPEDPRRSIKPMSPAALPSASASSETGGKTGN